MSGRSLPCRLKTGNIDDDRRNAGDEEGAGRVICACCGEIKARDMLEYLKTYKTMTVKVWLGVYIEYVKRALKLIKDCGLFDVI